MFFKASFTCFIICCSALFSKELYQEPWGKDTQLIHSPPTHKQVSHSLGVKVADKMIHFYQETISKANGPKSHFKPSSSQYTKLAIQEHGFVKGFLMGCDRLIRENNDPWVYHTTQVDGYDYKLDPIVRN